VLCDQQHVDQPEPTDMDNHVAGRYQMPKMDLPEPTDMANHVAGRYQMPKMGVQAVTSNYSVYSVGKTQQQDAQQRQKGEGPRLLRQTSQIKTETRVHAAACFALPGRAL